MDLQLIAVVMIVLTLFATLANAFGVDSRDESSDPRRPSYPVAIA